MHFLEDITNNFIKDMGCTQSSGAVQTEHIIAARRHESEESEHRGQGNLGSKNIHVSSGNGGGSKVIVLGSGIAGMAAANQLAKRGYDVTVLEANNYIGGRLKSIPVKLSNGSVFAFDEGASWIHGSCEKNPITILSKQIKGLKLIQTLDDSIVNYDKSGQEAQQQVDKAFEQYQRLLQKMQQFPNVSAQQAVAQLNPSMLSNKYFMFNVSNDVQFQTSGGFHQLSAQYAQSDSQFQGTEMLITTGYQAFPQHLARSANVRVFLNHKVVEVENRGKGSVVKCSNGTSFEGQRVVVAVPIGPLKSGSIKFKPQLPSKKIDAIKNINFGNVCKILIVLKNKNIGHKEHYIGVIQDDVNKRGCATYFLNITGIAGLPAMMTFGLGVNADQIEYMKEADLKKLIASRIKVFAQDDINVNDFDIVRTNWRGNPNFAGAYSFSGVTTLPKHWRDIAEPVFERGWYFCGEHTHSKYRGTVHGAYLSGIDAAGALMQNIKEDDWQYYGQGSGSESGDEGKKKQKSSKKSRSKSKESKKSKSSKKSEKSSKKKDKKKGSDSD